MKTCSPILSIMFGEAWVGTARHIPGENMEFSDDLCGENIRYGF